MLVLCRFTLRGELEEDLPNQGGVVAGKSKLKFELEVCLVCTTSSNSNVVVGIRRKRLKGDAWCYKRVCEGILNMANMQ